MQIIPPRGPLVEAQRHDQAAWAERAPAAGGLFSSFRARAKAGRQARTLRAMTEEMEAARAYFDARALAIESCRKAQDEEYRLRSLPKHAADQRSAEYHARLHEDNVRELAWRREYDDAQALTVSARQALDAQRGIGDELAWKKRRVELLDVELSMAERKAILREHAAEFGLRPNASEDEVAEALHEARSQLRASGLDTGKIDAVLARRTSKSSG